MKQYRTISQDEFEDLLSKYDLGLSADLSYVDLTPLSIRSGSRLTHANFRGAKLSNMVLEGIDLSDSTFRSTDMTNVTLRNCNLSRVMIKRAHFEGCTAQACDLTDIDIQQMFGKIEVIN